MKQNEIKIFNSEEFGNIRTTDINGKPYFCASDVAKALGYSNPNKAIKDHCRAIAKRSTPISGKMQEINFIPEGDIYRLIIKSKLPSSVRFESWVFDEVLPQIRKTGTYQMQPMTEIQIMQRSLEIINQHDEDINMLKEETAELKRKIDVIGAYENSLQYRKLRGLCSARVKELLDSPIYHCLWSPFLQSNPFYTF